MSTRSLSAAGALDIPEEIRHKGLYYGDCLDVMRRWYDEQADLIYLDPPFNSDQDYNVLYGTDHLLGRTAQREAFSDTWVWDAVAEDRVNGLRDAGPAHPLRALTRALYKLLGESGMLAYLTYMAERLLECHRILKPSGSVFLHCDDTASHYLKVVMDAIFDAKNYRNDITWRRSTAHHSANRFGRICDSILFYAKDKPSMYWNGNHLDAGIPKTPEQLAKSYRKDDNDNRGRYRTGDLTGAGIRHGESGSPWKGYDITTRGRHWAVPIISDYAKWIEENIIPGYRSIEGSHDRLDALDDAGMIHHPTTPRGYWPGLKRYARADRGVTPPQSLILDPMGFTNYTTGGEYTGYDTQKPIKLLEPLIVAACPPNGTVLDPFAGCGTTVVAAHLKGRRWAGIDIGLEALRVTKEQQIGSYGVTDAVIYGIPTDLESARFLASHDAFAFERWAVQNIPGMYYNTHQTSDGGIDGRGEIWSDMDAITGPDTVASPLVVAQVSASEHPTAGKVRDFCHVVNRERAAFGLFITLDYTPTNAARSEARGMGETTVQLPGGLPNSYHRLQFWSIRDHFTGASPQLPPMKNPHTGQAVGNTLFS